MFFRDPSRCPSCGERVTPYAAGCAICGADLDPRRWQSRPSLLRRLVGRRRRPATREAGYETSPKRPSPVGERT